MTGPDQEQWLGPVRRDGRWWVVRADGDRVGWADDVRWHPGWPPGRRRWLTRLLIALALTYAVVVPGWLVAVARICPVPECGAQPLLAVQEPRTTGRLPTVLAAPCSRVPVDRVVVERVTADGREPMLRLERSGGPGALTFPLDRVTAGYRETTGRPRQELVDQLARYREQQRRALAAIQAGAAPAAVDSDRVEVALTYSDGSSESRGLSSGVDGRYSYETYAAMPPGGSLSAEHFGELAAGSDVCLPRGVRPGDWVVGVFALLAGFGVAVAVRSVRRGRYADELVRLANGQVPAEAR